jgi:exopolysaccharide production protein ExoQ
VNLLFLAAMVVSAIVILTKRRLSWTTLMRSNKALFLAYGFFLLSMFWSEMPWVSARRTVKDFSAVLIALIFLTEDRPAEAIRTAFVRVSYILYPLSVIFIKYFPQIGRQVSRAGENMFTGVSIQKNSLGETVFVFSLMILWDLMEIWKSLERPGKRIQIYIRGGMLLMGSWLLITCDSQTSILCLLLGIAVFAASRRLVKMRQGKQILIATFVFVAIAITMDKTLGLSEALLKAMGRDPSLTGRTEIWRLVLEQNTDPLIGYGFYTFWDSKKGLSVIDQFMQINSAHNGFLEMYLDGGLIGATLVVVFLLAAGGRAIARLFNHHPLGTMGLIYWVLILLYNFSESSFFRPDLLWFTFLLVIIDVPLEREYPKMEAV